MFNNFQTLNVCYNSYMDILYEFLLGFDCTVCVCVRACTPANYMFYQYNNIHIVIMKSVVSLSHARTHAHAHTIHLIHVCKIR